MHVRNRREPTKAKQRLPLAHYLAFQYTFHAIACEEGGYFITFPDLPGCMTQVELDSEIVEMADEARRLWIATTYDEGDDVPLPSYPPEPDRAHA